jgi:flagellin-like hook-associated protein FlgL
MTIDVNSGTAAERYLLKQGSSTIFDTGDWDTRGNAKTWDYDRFIVEYSPGKDTTFEFVPMSDGNSSSIDLDGPDNDKETLEDNQTLPADNSYDNKSYYLGNLGLSDDGSDTGMAAYLGRKFSQLGSVTTNQSDGSTTDLTLRIESKTLFQIAASYSVPSTPSNYVSVGDVENVSILLEPIGLGLLQDMSIATADDAADAVNSISDEIEGIAAQMANLGANLSRLEVAADRMSGHVSAGQAGLSRMTEGSFAEESLNFAKEQMRSESRLALMTQARRLRENLFGVLLR